MDIVEKDKAFEVTAELPGLDAKNIDVQLADGMLTIKGEKQEEKEEKTKDRYVSERRYGSFRRSVAGTRQRRRREDRSELQERRPDRHTAEVAGSAEEGEDDPGKREVSKLPASPDQRVDRRGPLAHYTDLIDGERRMAHKQMLFHSAAREKILRGASLLADAVRVTLGPEVEIGPDRKEMGRADRLQ